MNITQIKFILTYSPTKKKNALSQVEMFQSFILKPYLSSNMRTRNEKYKLSRNTKFHISSNKSCNNFWCCSFIFLLNDELTCNMPNKLWRNLSFAGRKYYLEIHTFASLSNIFHKILNPQRFEETHCFTQSIKLEYFFC